MTETQSDAGRPYISPSPASEPPGSPASAMSEGSWIVDVAEDGFFLAGFGYGVARRIIGAESPGEVEAGDGTGG